MDTSDDNLFGKAVQRSTGLAESGIQKKTRQLVGTDDSDEEKKRKRRQLASTSPEQSPVSILGTPTGGK